MTIVANMAAGKSYNLAVTLSVTELRFLLRISAAVQLPN
jgi:hypothetical protein